MPIVIALTGPFVPKMGQQPFLHFSRRFVSEGDGGDMGGIHAPLLHQIGDAANQGPGLAGSGAGDDGHGAFFCRGGGPLLVVESIMGGVLQSHCGRGPGLFPAHLPRLFSGFPPCRPHSALKEKKLTRVPFNFLRI